MHTVCIVGRSLHSFCKVNCLFVCLYSEYQLHIKGFLCTLVIHSSTSATVVCFAVGVVQCKEPDWDGSSSSEPGLTNGFQTWTCPASLPPSLLSHEAIWDRNKSKKQCIRL